MTSWRRVVAALGLTAATVVGWAAPASAHASVVSSTPAPGAHLTRAPSSVTVVFDQPVKPDGDALTVLDSTGSNVDEGSFSHVSPNVLSVSLRPSLGQGAYVWNYTVTSLDGHVVSGGVVFLVGRATTGSITQLARPRTSVTTWIDDLGQFLIYLGVLVAAGLAFFLAFVLEDGPERARLRRLTWLAAGTGVVGMLVTVGAQVALTGGGARSIGDWGVDSQILTGTLGAQSGLQLVGLALCLSSLALGARMARQFAAFYGLLVSAGAFVVFGHATVSPERWLSIPADVVHASFAAMWAGGLVGLVLVLHSRVGVARRAGQLVRSAAPTGSSVAGRAPSPVSVGGAGRRSAPATAVLERRSDQVRLAGAGNGSEPSDPSLFASTLAVVSRFSTMAGISFAAILVAGVLLAVAEVGSVANLFETGYGQLLLVKISLVALLLFLAWYNRFLLLPHLSRAASGAGGLSGSWRRLLGTVRLEAVVMVAVLAVTSVLANGTPSNGATLPPPQPFHQSQPFNGGSIRLSITPNQALVNDWTVQFTDATGAPAEMAESVSIYLTLPSKNVGPIEADLVKTGVGRFQLADTPNPPIAGQWQVVAQVQVSAFLLLDVSFVDTVQ